MSIKTTLHAQGYEPWTLDYLGVTGAKWIKFVNAFPVLADATVWAIYQHTRALFKV